MRTIHNENNNFHQYPIQSEPQGAYVEIDCINKTLSSTYNGEIGNAVPFSVWHGHDQRFGISPYLTVTAINVLLDEIEPIAKRVIAGFKNKWDGNNWKAFFDDDAKEAIGEITDICDGYEGETFDVYTWAEYLEYTIADLNEYKTLDEAKEGLREDLGLTVIADDFEDFIVELVENCNSIRELQLLPKWVATANCDEGAEKIIENFCYEIEEYLIDAIMSSDWSDTYHTIGDVEAYSWACPFPYNLTSETIRQNVLNGMIMLKCE